MKVAYDKPKHAACSVIKKIRVSCVRHILLSLLWLNAERDGYRKKHTISTSAHITETPTHYKTSSTNHSTSYNNTTQTPN
jgi:hypothetical protein